MLTFRSAADVPAGFGPSAVTVGKFDGLHLGHRAVIERTLDLARTRELASVVVTFDRNPLSLLRPESQPPSLLSNRQRLDRLEATGIDATLMITFDHEFSVESPEQFVDSILVEALQARVVLVGSDFRFGSHGAGTVVTLKAFGEARGFEVLVIEDVAPVAGPRISSTWIRALMAEGDVAAAGRLLGAPPSVRAEVVHGQQRGRTLGYPTANLSPQLEGFVPADGVYAALLTVDGVQFPAAVSVGNNPTFEGVPEKQIEAHVLDQTMDLYGKIVEVAFVEFIRGMRKFSGVDALAEQMALDESRIRTILGVAQRGH